MFVLKRFVPCVKTLMATSGPRVLRFRPEGQSAASQEVEKSDEPSPEGAPSSTK